MAFWKWLFASSNQPKGRKESTSTPDTTPRLACPLCGEVYLIGKDATIVTMGNVLGFLTGAGTPVIGSESALAGIMQTPALVGHYDSGWSATELNDKKSETLGNVETIRQALQSGQKPQWECFKCREKNHPNYYPSGW